MPAVECPELHHCTAQCLSEPPPRKLKHVKTMKNLRLLSQTTSEPAYRRRHPRKISVDLLFCKANAMRTVLYNANKCAPRGRHMPARVRKLQLKTDMNGFYLSTI